MQILFKIEPFGRDEAFQAGLYLSDSVRRPVRARDRGIIGGGFFIPVGVFVLQKPADSLLSINPDRFCVCRSRQRRKYSEKERMTDCRFC
jgi:hypothetical protein